MSHGRRGGSNQGKRVWDPTYGSWREMKRRCLDPKRPDFKYYGALGVQVCPQWLAKPGGFIQFLADVGARPEGHTLDRIDPYGHYEPDNVRWRPTLENSSDNRRARWDYDAYGPPPDDAFRVEPKWPELVVVVELYQSPQSDLDEMPF